MIPVVLSGGGQNPLVALVTRVVFETVIARRQPETIVSVHSEAPAVLSNQANITGTAACSCCVPTATSRSWHDMHRDPERDPEKLHRPDSRLRFHAA